MHNDVIIIKQTANSSAGGTLEDPVRPALSGSEISTSPVSARAGVRTPMPSRTRRFSCSTQFSRILFARFTALPELISNLTSFEDGAILGQSH